MFHGFIAHKNINTSAIFLPNGFLAIKYAAIIERVLQISAGNLIAMVVIPKNFIVILFKHAKV